MIEVKPARELGEGVKHRISEIFVECFGQHFTYFSKDKNTLVKAFEHSFRADVFYVALVDGEIAGITACTNGIEGSVKFDRKELIKHLGLYKGNIAYFTLKSAFGKPCVKIGEGIASVEFVATALQYQGKGVATAIMKYLFALPQYKEYVLSEIADNNINAIRLYEKLGFKELIRKKLKKIESKFSGIQYYISMNYVKENI